MGIIRSLRADKISQTFKDKGIDNFYNWRIKAKAFGLIPNPEKVLVHDDKLAFLIGLIYGDGCLTKMARTDCLRFTLGTDKPDLAHHTVDIVEKVFGKRPSIIKRSNSNCFNVTLYQKNICNRLEMKPGARGNKNIVFPNWIWKKDSFLVSLLKGLYEAEASYCVHLPTYTYNFEFSNRNASILDIVESILCLFGFHPESRPYAVRIRRKTEAIRLKEIIRFRTYS